MATCGLEHGKMCEQVTQLKDCQGTLFKKCDEMVRDMSQKVGFRLFIWLMGIIILILTGIIGYTHAVDKDMARGTACIQVLQMEMQHVTKTVERIDRKLDRMNGVKKADD